MSNLNTIALIAAVFIAGYAAFIFADRWIHDRGEVIVTGFVRGLPLTTTTRWLMLISNWFTVVFSLVMFAFLVSCILVGIGRNAGDPFVQFLAYTCAFAFSGISLVWIVLGASWFMHYRRVLREAEAA
jgi:hypothetical protein